jgi:hypothetical protein
MSRHRYKFGGYKRASVWSLELCSTAVYSGTGRENATLRTETASPSCSQGRPGARPWLCSWEEVHIAIPENGTPSTTPAGPPRPSVCLIWLPPSKNWWPPSKFPQNTFSNRKSLPECRRQALGNESGSFPSTRTRRHRPRLQEAAQETMHV